MNYKNYQNARDTAWKILIDCKIDRLPVNLNAICHSLKIKVLTYGGSQKIIQQARIGQVVKHTDGMTLYIHRTPVVLFDESASPQRAKFTVAHEVGHIVLGHVAPGGITTANREPHPGDDMEEQAANQFAARLLAPACVLWGLDIHTAKDIMNLCRISRPAAEFRAYRMEELYRRNKFLTSSLEQQVYSQFRPFIQGFRRSHPEG